MVDRSTRYSKPGKAPGGTAGAKTGAEKTAGGKAAPHPKDQPEKKSDPGPEAGKDATWGVVADRHKREHGDMSKRHAEELAATLERHGKEAKDLQGRHSTEMVEQLKAPEAKAEKTAGDPPELGKQKSEGTKGAEV